MAKKRIVITGLGILNGMGKSREEYWQALKDGKIGYRPITLFDASEFNVRIAGEISDFDATIYMGKKGLRTLDRSIKLMVSAGRLAIDDSQFQITEENSEDVGVSVGTTLGSLKSIADFDDVTLKEGPRYVNPALFPNTVINAPASQVNIWHKIKGFSTTLSTGFTAALDAMSYAYNFLQWDRAKVIYAGGVEELCWHTFFCFHTLKFISGAKDGTEFINCPFDKRRNGITFGEGACLFCMEDVEHAKARNARILGEIASFGYSFDPFRLHKYNPRGTGLKLAIEDALNNAGLMATDIDYICANANSTVAADKIESMVIKQIFGEYGKKVPVSSVKSMVGECYSVTGGFSAAAALGAIHEGFIPPTMNYQEPDPDCDLNIIANKSCPANLKNVLVVGFAPSGASSCMILRKYEE
jgi:3-oxoacyl-[acyl-carrier-protein] synthase II